MPARPAPVTPRPVARSRWRRLPWVILLATALSTLAPVSAGAAPPLGLLTRVSADPFTEGMGYHASEVEPHILAYGRTIVATFQTGRVYNGGASDIGWSTSINGGESWLQGQLPLTVWGGGPTSGDGLPIARASDTVVAYNAKFHKWIINTLGIAGDANVTGIFNNVSDDGVHWSQPQLAHLTGETQSNDSPDKNWIVCDNWPTSPHYGYCYIAYDNNGNGNRLRMMTITDDPANNIGSPNPDWSTDVAIADNSTGIGVVPVVQPDGKVVVPYAGGGGISWFTSVFTGSGPYEIPSWSAHTQILPNMTTRHTEAGGLRTSLLPASAVDGAGTVYVVWQTRTFRSPSTAQTPNDVAVSTFPLGGTAFTGPVRIPIEADIGSGNTIDHFLPSIAADTRYGGADAHLGLFYSFYPVSACIAYDPLGNDCNLSTGFVSSVDGGAHWSDPTILSSGTTMAMLPRTSQGPMNGDYIGSTVVTDGVLAGKAFSSFAVGQAGSSGLNTAMYVPTRGAAVAGGPNALAAPSAAALSALDELIAQSQEENVPPLTLH